ncbi:MAG TPA: hypothetical protein VFA18_05470 [Gemmataceae bacterium]|nr:hypothetical protein [Gemmataceae bacterium]
MPLVPYRFLFRIAYPCRYVKAMPLEEQDRLLELSEDCRIDNFGGMDEARSFADVRLAWNEFGLGFQAEVRGKEQEPRGDAARPRGSDGVTLWLDTRDARASHRASRYCHQFHFLPAGGGPERDEPWFGQSKIHRALQDAPLASPADVPFQAARVRGGYILEAFLPAAVLTGFDPEQNRRLGVYYAVHDAELGEQVLSVGAEFPYWEDPSLWSVLELMS